MNTNNVTIYMESSGRITRSQHTVNTNMSASNRLMIGAANTSTGPVYPYIGKIYQVGYWSGSGTMNDWATGELDLFLERYFGVYVRFADVKGAWDFRNGTLTSGSPEALVLTEHGSVPFVTPTATIPWVDNFSNDLLGPEGIVDPAPTDNTTISEVVSLSLAKSIVDNVDGTETVSPILSAQLTYRVIKGTPLTNTEIDANFTYINNKLVENSFHSVSWHSHTPQSDKRLSSWLISDIDLNGNVADLDTPSGTPTEPVEMLIRINCDTYEYVDLNWDPIYRATSFVLPTRISGFNYLHIQYHVTDAKWDVIGMSAVS